MVNQYKIGGALAQADMTGDLRQALKDNLGDGFNDIGVIDDYSDRQSFNKDGNIILNANGITRDAENASIAAESSNILMQDGNGKRSEKYGGGSETEKYMANYGTGMGGLLDLLKFDGTSGSDKANLSGLTNMNDKVFSVNGGYNQGYAPEETENWSAIVERDIKVPGASQYKHRFMMVGQDSFEQLSSFISTLSPEEQNRFIGKTPVEVKNPDGTSKGFAYTFGAYNKNYKLEPNINDDSDIKFIESNKISFAEVGNPGVNEYENDKITVENFFYYEKILNITNKPYPDFGVIGTHGNESGANSNTFASKECGNREGCNDLKGIAPKYDAELLNKIYKLKKLK